ncbi:hypothetical protein BC827DRAFT_1252325 [Russula dissimulans]|nr:hypothetical protein BC827DRAFT_1252325 [Russula dissimulans]
MNSAPSDSASVISVFSTTGMSAYYDKGSKVLFAVKSMGPTATSCTVPCSHWQCYWWPREQTDTRPRRPTRSRNLEAPFTSTRIMTSYDEEDVLMCSMAGHRASDRGSGSRSRDCRNNRSGNNDDDSSGEAEGGLHSSVLHVHALKVLNLIFRW